jgi:hypothetical protein
MRTYVLRTYIIRDVCMELVDLCFTLVYVYLCPVAIDTVQ